jgi:endonuclease/exonuclease/phosphatase family metal-dependent hydrolase
LLFLTFIMNLSAYSQAVKNSSLRIMTFNVRVSFADDGDNNWAFRKTILFNAIRKNTPDILCLQEATPEVIQALLTNLPEYSTYGRGRDSISGINTESCHIFYKTEKFRVDSSCSGTFWFSNTPEVPGSKSWNTACTRICTFTRLVEIKSKEGVFIYNNHWDHLSVEARDSSAVLLIKRINKRHFPEENCIVTGDFNAEDKENSIKYLLSEKGGLSDVFDLLKTSPDSISEKTFHGFTGIGTARIDYILLQKGSVAKVADCFVSSYNENGRFPSDHFPVICDFVLE